MTQDIIQNNYPDMLRSVIAEVKATRVIVANRVNSSVIQMYWNIGKRLSEEKLEKGYGSKVVEQLSLDLRHEFPNTKGFSARNLWDMKRFFEFYCLESEILRQPVAELPETKKLQQPVAESAALQKLRQPVAEFNPYNKKLPQCVAELSWGHHLMIINKIKDVKEALYYIEAAAKQLWTRDMLLHFIKADTYRNTKLLPKTHNFERTLSEDLQRQADEMLKSSYNLDFLGIRRPLKELELESRIVEKIKLFLLELGEGFSFIGNQHRLSLNAKEYFVDLLFFNRKIKSLVAIDLKIGEFEPEFVGKMNYYLGLLDDQMRMEGENPSIGIILCAEKDHVEVEVALRDVHKPIGIADYQLFFPEKEIKQLINRELNE